jgi:hypothetical protein
VNGTNLFAGTNGAQAWRRPLSEMTAIERNGYSMPRGFWLVQNSPNSFDPQTNFAFNLPQAEYVTLKVHDITGREIATLVKDPLSSGTHRVAWNTNTCANGVYCYFINAGQHTEAKKMVLVK